MSIHSHENYCNNHSLTFRKISRFNRTSPLNSNALLHFRLERCKSHKATSHQTKCDVTISYILSMANIAVIQSDIALQKHVHKMLYV